jgi:hypothetical protein
MAKAKRVHSTPRRTKSAPSSATDRPEEVEMKAPGCRWVMASGVIGLSTSLTVYDADSALGDASELAAGEREALADYMIGLWTRFRDENRVAPSSTSPADIQVRGASLAEQFIDVEGDVRDLCRAVKVISCVITDQLSHPAGGVAPVTSDYGLEVQPFYVDADMLRFAVEHAADIALTVSHKIQ